MGNTMNRLIILLALVGITLNGCIVVPEHDYKHRHHDDGDHEGHGDEHVDYEGHGNH